MFIKKKNNKEKTLKELFKYIDWIDIIASIILVFLLTVLSKVVLNNASFGCGMGIGAVTGFICYKNDAYILRSILESLNIKEE